MWAQLKQLVRDIAAGQGLAAAPAYASLGGGGGGGGGDADSKAEESHPPSMPTTTPLQPAAPPLTEEQYAAMMDERMFGKMVAMWRYHEAAENVRDGGDDEDENEEDGQQGAAPTQRFTDDDGGDDNEEELADLTAVASPGGTETEAEAADRELRRILALRLAAEQTNERAETVSFLYDFDDAYLSDADEGASGSSADERRVVLVESLGNWLPLFVLAPGVCVVQAALLTALARDYFVATYQTLSLQHPLRRAAFSLWHAREHFGAPVSREAALVVDASAWRAFPSNFCMLARTDSTLMQRVSDAFCRHGLDEAPEAETRRAFGIAVVPPLLVRILFGAARLSAPEGEWRVLPISFALLTDPVTPLVDRSVRRPVQEGETGSNSGGSGNSGGIVIDTDEEEEEDVLVS